jgi:hypothetical protein
LSHSSSPAQIFYGGSPAMNSPWGPEDRPSSCVQEALHSPQPQVCMHWDESFRGDPQASSWRLSVLGLLELHWSMQLPSQASNLWHISVRNPL